MNDNVNEVINTNIAHVWLDDDGIMRSMLIPNAEITLGDTKGTVAAYRKVS